MKKILIILILILIVLTGIFVTSQNYHDATVSYFWGSVTMPMVFALFLAFTAGAILTMVVALFWMARQRHQIRRLEKSKQLIQKELDNLRAVRAEIE